MGPLCEFIVERVNLGKSVNTTTKMNVTVTNKYLTPEIEDTKSNESKTFLDTFQAMMAEAYKAIKEYRGINITNMRNGSIIVEYNLTLEISYAENISVTAQYNNLVPKIEQAMGIINNYSKDCSSAGNLCFSKSTILQKASLRSEDETCRDTISPGFEEFFTAKIIGGNLVCVSDCDQQSKRFYDCNAGTCQILNRTGPECLCRNTDLYIYATDKCQGQMLKSAVYGGVGAAIALLAVIVASVGFLLFRAKKQQKFISQPFSKDQENTWYDNDNDNEWSSQRGFGTITQGAANGEGGNANGSYSSSSSGSFRPALQNVDTKIQVKIQRPVITPM
ncbi:mucin-3B-like [Xenopus tropicalis]|uniref:Mucin-3B-like n=1 Tax=Xenopus tropicalis TaxID=8364 RepID=A0A8J1JBV3_XENTR|nr:mucin-3B-like [Xenopus tropicalis]